MGMVQGRRIEMLLEYRGGAEGVLVNPGIGQFEIVSFLECGRRCRRGMRWISAFRYSPRNVRSQCIQLWPYHHECGSVMLFWVTTKVDSTRREIASDATTECLLRLDWVSDRDQTGD